MDEIVPSCRMSEPLLAPSTFTVLILRSDLSHKYFEVKIKSYVINKETNTEIDIFDYNSFKKFNLVINYSYSFRFSLIEHRVLQSFRSQDSLINLWINCLIRHLEITKIKISSLFVVFFLFLQTIKNSLSITQLIYQDNL